MDYAFDALGWDRVIHTIDPQNLASQRLAQRLGSALLGPTRLPAPHDQVQVEMWGQSRTEWMVRRSALV